MATLVSLATALPPHRFHQEQAKQVAARLFNGDGTQARRLSLFDNAGIAWRSSCLPLETYLEPRSFAERNRLSVEHATALLCAAGKLALARAGLPIEAVDVVVAVCSTGIATPSLDALVAEQLGLRSDVQRMPLFGLGCAGGVLGLARAGALARAEPGSVVLLLVVELCTLTLRLDDQSQANLVACALFADGAAAAVLVEGSEGPRLAATGEHRWPDSLDVMGWRVEDEGLGVLFSVAVPEIARTRLRAATESFLARSGRDLPMIDRWICHPGGAKVIAALAEAFELDHQALEDTRGVLHDHGNMSAATVLFVLERALMAPGWRTGLIASLGPGFTAGFGLIERPA
jgi:alkylresorcinol/alkylpyrone synthase